ncbi:NADH:flavin oxidoreductase [Microlunatus capsulatus]|uniref:2,4-dienoyl-CoA reductase-like NADH-dependent reductase (Old Yellow Enzyme family) n=1 Tax=Microlunatus capsulatus TaxID=99117 RepID=A0ABS4Z8T0_9ACTN|nr:NADH:flavin oxidoreductase [Microlunatus capsulatus]MBP2417459.1 2,4-dienoyl-CoA reductase-like NADH-dependent reductase (Old Yellow Enzyme family) [Microlunatus capsulatus]
MTVDVSPLFTPFRLGSLQLANRFVMAPMTREFSPGGIPGPDVAAYYARRAAGDVGLIVTEGTFIDHAAAGDRTDVPQFYGDQALQAWQEVARAVHAAGGRIVPQLWHRGAQRPPGSGPHPETSSISPSGRYPGLTGSEAMSVADIDEVVSSYARAAADAQRLGFDGIELHGAHGYLLDQFLWSGTNLRTDLYGGGPAGRARFAAEVVAACRAATSPAFPIIFRLSNWKAGDYHARLAQTPHELEAVLAPLLTAGVDVFHVSTRRHVEAAFPDSSLGLAGWVKKITATPTITVGGVGLDGDLMTAYTAGGRARTVPLDQLLDQFEEGQFDLVAVGRALLSDPEWVLKVQQGRFEDLRSFDAADREKLA